MCEIEGDMLSDWQKDLNNSLEMAMEDIAILSRSLPGVEKVEKTSDELDKQGADYIVTLRKGSQILVDVKRRNKGASKHWQNGCEIALESWSIIPGTGGEEYGRVGWTLSESTQADYILFVFDPSDSSESYLVPFQLLRSVFRKRYYEWREKYAVRKNQTQGCYQSWVSESVFVPISVVLQEIVEVMPIKAEKAESA